MKNVSFFFLLFLLACNGHNVDFADEYYALEADEQNVMLRINAEKGILKGESFRKDKKLICYLKGTVKSDGFISYNEYFDEGECYGVFEGKFTTTNNGHQYFRGIWRKPDPEKPLDTIKFIKQEAIVYLNSKAAILKFENTTATVETAKSKGPYSKISRFWSNITNSVRRSTQSEKPETSKANERSKRDTEQKKPLNTEKSGFSKKKKSKVDF